jgi:hypothetical protein
MAITHAYSNRVTIPGLPSLPADPPLNILGNYETTIDEVCNATATTEIDIGTVAFTSLVSLVFNSTGPCVINTNAVPIGTVGQTFTLAASKTFFWNNALDPVSFPNPLTKNVSKLYIVNAGANSLTFRGGILLNV